MFNRLQGLKADTDLEFIKEFLESAPKQMEEDFVNLSRSIRANDVAKNKFHAHKLKGLLMTIGADDAAAICSHIETHASTGDTSDMKSIFVSLETKMEDVRQILDRIKPKLLDS
ncbi:MAG: Hpt domain-containing protein [Ignavibacteriales bacterium]|nr:Hpt domain-containing protein [Ignavibacteriales bacterium]